MICAPIEIQDTLTDALDSGGLAWLVGGVLLVALLANMLAKRVIVRAVRAIVARSAAKWDDVIVEHRVFEKLSHLAPALVVYLAADSLFRSQEQQQYVLLLKRFCNVWMIIAGARTVMALLDALITLGQRDPGWRNRPCAATPRWSSSCCGSPWASSRWRP